MKTQRPDKCPDEKKGSTVCVSWSRLPVLTAEGMVRAMETSAGD